jgi:hypothetical protein
MDGWSWATGATMVHAWWPFLHVQKVNPHSSLMPPRRRVVHPFVNLQQRPGDFEGELWTLQLTSRTGARSYVTIDELTPIGLSGVSWRVAGRVSGPWRDYEVVVRILPGQSLTRRQLLTLIATQVANAYRYGRLD